MVHPLRLDRILPWALSEQRCCLGLATFWSVHLTPDRSWLPSKLMDCVGGRSGEERGMMDEEISFVRSASGPQYVTRCEIFGM